MIMNKIVGISCFLMAISSFIVVAQNIQPSGENYGKTFNIGLGAGYYNGGYGDNYSSMPVLQINYEFEVAKYFTLAPFIGVYSYRYDNYWKGPKYQNRYYYYRETVVPVGIKGTYYFDKLLEANSNWDFYLAGSLGFAFRSVRWENGYDGDRDLSNSPLFLDLHIGAEYHINRKVGLFLDLSTGASSIGLAFH